MNIGYVILSGLIVATSCSITASSTSFSATADAPTTTTKTSVEIEFTESEKNRINDIEEQMQRINSDKASLRKKMDDESSSPTSIRNALKATRQGQLLLLQTLLDQCKLMINSIKAGAEKRAAALSDEGQIVKETAPATTAS